MNRWIIPLLTGLLPLSLVAQKDSLRAGPETPYNPAASYKTWSIKGKVLPWFLGNAGGLSGMLGLEYGFTRSMSIGVDAFGYYEESSDDDVRDTAGVTHDVGNYWHSWERAVLLNYRYYFSFQRLRKKGIVPYTVIFLRYGRIDRHADPLYPLTSYLDDHERHRSAGILIGSTFYGKEGDRLGLDVNFGLFEKQKDITTVYLKNGVESTTHSSPVGLGFRLSVNLEIWFKQWLFR